MSDNHDLPVPNATDHDRPGGGDQSHDSHPPRDVPDGRAGRQPRRDGWTFARQAEFLDDLGQHGNVARAAGAVGMSASSAYRLRGREAARDPHGAFAAGWRAATAMAYHHLRDLAFERIENGTVQTVYYKGALAGTRLVYSDRLLIAMLNHLRPELPPAPAGDPAEPYAAAMDAFAIAVETDTAPVMPAVAPAAPAAAAPDPADRGPSPGEGPYHDARGAAARARLRRGEDPHPVRFPGRIYAPHPDDVWLESYPDGLTAEDLACEDDAELAFVGLTRDGLVRDRAAHDGLAREEPCASA